MKHRDGIARVQRLESALATLKEQAKRKEARLSSLIRESRDHASARAAAGRALDEIARTRLYRLRNYTSFAEFLAAEIGIARVTAHRLRVEATASSAKRSPERREAEAAARALRAEVKRAGLRGVRVRIARWQGKPSVELVLRPHEVAEVRLARRR